MDMDGKVVRTYTEIPFWYKNDVQGGNDDHDHDHHYDGYLRRKGERKKERKN